MGEGQLNRASERDRGPDGRPRNARPRDRTGRPLPRDASPDPQIAEPGPLGPAAALDRAQQLIDEGLPFAAHEVLEAEWKSAAGDRDAWRGLAQLAVGLTHLQRGNRVGAARLLRRGAAGVEPRAGSIPGIDRGLPDEATRLADRIEAGDAGVSPWLRLTAARPGSGGP